MPGTVVITYSHPGCGQADCTLYIQTATVDAAGDVAGYTSTFSTQSYHYDAAARITKATDLLAAACTTRVYGFGSGSAGTASDRTSLTSYGPAQDGSCQTTTAANAQSWTYDTADRVTTAGYAYDTLGRTTAVPMADTQNGDGGDLAVGYSVNDLVSSLTQGGATVTYRTDVDNARARSWTDGAGTTHTNHYADSSNSPTWTDDGGGQVTRFVRGADHADAIASTAGGVAWQITNLHGDFVATTTDGLALDSVDEADEFGVLRDASKLGTVRYGWSGSQDLRSDNPGGLVTMGVRLYNPVTGRFLSPDPEPGGNANPYVYCASQTLDCADPSGRAHCHTYLFVQLCGRLINDMSFSVKISRDRNAYNQPIGPYRWLPSWHRSTEYWKDNDMLRVGGRWKVMHDDIGYHYASEWFCTLFWCKTYS